MKPNIALVLFYLYHGYTYEIEMTVPCKSATYARLHKCIQPFVRSANFKYELVINSATESLNMVADIADDISESIITKYCEQYATINRKTNVQDTYEQSKEFVGEKSSMGDGHNPASDEISVYSYKGESSNPQGVTTRSCLILQPNLPELWIQDCTRCLAFEKQYERFFVTRKDLGSYQWAFLYTFAEKKILHCQSTCGTVTLVSETDCYAARLYQTLAIALPSRPEDLTDFSYEQHLVPYTKETMEKCISCAQNNILPFIMNNNEGEMNFVAYTDPGFELRLFKLNCVTTSMCKAPKTLLSKKVDDLLANFKALGSSKDEPRNPDKEDTTSSSTCMHFSTSVYAAGNAYMYPIMMNYPASKPHTQFPSCYSCMLKELGRVDHVPSLEDLVESIQPTSSRSSLVFFKQELHVQEAAIRCTEKCKWVTGLSKKVCAFLGDMAIIEKKRSQIDSVGTHSTAARPPKRKANEVTIGENDPMVTYALMSASTHSFIPSNEKPA